MNCHEAKSISAHGSRTRRLHVKGLYSLRGASASHHYSSLCTTLCTQGQAHQELPQCWLGALPPGFKFAANQIFLSSSNPICSDAVDDHCVSASDSILEETDIICYFGHADKTFRQNQQGFCPAGLDTTQSAPSSVDLILRAFD